FHDNVMGIVPGGAHQPNGLDFWWDSFSGNTANCWFNNTSYRPITTDPAFPPGLPNCNNGQNPGSSVGTGNPTAESELLGCFAAISGGPPDTCPWFTTPPKPKP
nr:hypothetical protein [Chloroflexota bacterium]